MKWFSEWRARRRKEKEETITASMTQFEKYMWDATSRADEWHELTPPGLGYSHRISQVFYRISEATFYNPHKDAKAGKEFGWAELHRIPFSSAAVQLLFANKMKLFEHEILVVRTAINTMKGTTP